MVKGAKSLVLLLMVLLVALPVSLAVTSVGHIKLLAVYQEGDGFKGSPADVQLEIKDGGGRVFMETIPLSKVDTQISTRFAKEMACKFAEVDCSRYDFFYTIKSPAGIVGGPSAGGAISALTVAMLLDLDIDQDAAMTGTINSGGLIGPVGSLKEKIEAANSSGIKKVLIPAVQEFLEDDNTTTIADYGAELDVEVVPVYTLREALQELTGKEFPEDEVEISVPDTYYDVMKDVSQKLCTRSDELLGNLNVFDLNGKKEIDFGQVEKQKDLQELAEKGKKAFDEGSYYSAASYCFGAGVKASTLLYEMENMTAEEASQEAERLAEDITDFDKKIESMDKNTLTDLQTYMIVKERVLEAKHDLVTGGNDSETFGYVKERLNSAVAWSGFFGTGGTEYNLDEKSLEGSCSEILADVDERFQYLNLFFPDLLNDLRDNLLTAHKHQESGDYALCIYLAGRTKAEANIIVTMLGVREEYISDLADQKMDAAKKAVTKQISKGIFPIIAYSYYEYATSLREDDPGSALLYSEYALELSDIDIYFEKKAEGIDWLLVQRKLKEYAPTATFIWGVVLGWLLCWVLFRERIRNKSYATYTSPAASAPKKTKKKSKARKTRTNIRLR
jgi:uncharacterized protein